MQNTIGRKKRTCVAAGFTVRGPLSVTFTFTSLLPHLEASFAFTARKLQCFQSYLTCTYSHAWFCLFVKQVGIRAHPWREKELRAGLLGRISKLVGESVLFS